MVDEVDRIILSHLGKNARMSSQELQKILDDLGHTITGRGIRHRLQKLEKNNVILGYSVILNPNILSKKINRTIILKFKFSKDTSELIDRLAEYVIDSQFCTFSSRLSGDYNWICHFVFDSIEQYDLEINNFLNSFGKLISDFRSYESNTIKSSPYMIYEDQEMKERKRRIYEIIESLKKYDNINDRFQEIVEYIVKYFDASFARIWLVDKQRKMLILKFSAGKYTRIDGNFSKVPINSLKIGHIAKTNKPVVSNDVVNDPRIKIHNWAKKEKLKSFIGYPLSYKGKAVAVVAMFSKKKMNHHDFELFGLFSEQLSKELTGFFEAKDFLSE
ncbi:GAF domain-containing protein [Nitrosopumilus sp.]|uniref:GAF domain-containing protein n=1 Tax=Nitrosopumilus sp. TaxID=2024843 RepID=UPI00247BDCA4|nr:GAF domain-containing protein [Nitrosopumilus sp.]MCV0430880.1 GAF domain-containing protein [Nitrosopumilus sp.]